VEVELPLPATNLSRDNCRWAASKAHPRLLLRVSWAKVLPLRVAPPIGETIPNRDMLLRAEYAAPRHSSILASIPKEPAPAAEGLSVVKNPSQGNCLTVVSRANPPHRIRASAPKQRAGAAGRHPAEMNLCLENYPREEWKARRHQLLRALSAKLPQRPLEPMLEEMNPSRDKPRMLAYAVHRR